MGVRRACAAAAMAAVAIAPARAECDWLRDVARCRAGGGGECWDLRGKVVGSQEVPFDAKVGGERVSELSGIAMVENGTRAVLVGDGGLLYVADLTWEDGDPMVSFVSGIKLEVSPGDDAVDAESIAVLCPVQGEDNETRGADHACSLGDPGTTLVVGSEKGKNHTAGVREYTVEGKLKDAAFVPEAALVAAGIDEAKQGNNLGFEAMTVLSDGLTVVMTTEGAVEGDDALDRRVAMYHRPTGAGHVYRYRVANEHAGVTDMAALRHDGSLLAMLERSYNNETRRFTVEVYYVEIDLEGGAAFARDSNDAPLSSDAFGELPELARLENSPLVSSSQLEGSLDNFEGLAFLPCRNSLLLVSDNNESSEQQQLFVAASLLDEFRAAGTGTQSPAASPDSASQAPSPADDSDTKSPSMTDGEPASRQPPLLLIAAALGIIAVTLCVGGGFCRRFTRKHHLLDEDGPTVEMMSDSPSSQQQRQRYNGPERGAAGEQDPWDVSMTVT